MPKACEHELCNQDKALGNFESHEVEQILACMAEQGELIFVGYDEDGAPLYKLAQE